MIRFGLFFKMLLLCSIFFSLGVLKAAAQNLGFEWVRKFDTTSSSRGIAIDADNKVYTAGIVNGTPRLYKFDALGNVLWMKQVAVQSSVGGVAELSSVQTDPFGNVFVTGHFNNTIYLNEQQDSLVASGTLATSMNGFIIKYDTAGNFRWAKSLGSGARQAYANNVTVDSKGSIALLGRYIGTGDFDPGPGTFTMTNGSTSSSLHNIYIVKLDSTGVFTWAKQFQGSAGVSNAFSIEADKWDNLIASGSFRGTMDFDPGPGLAQRTATGGTDGYVVKLDSAGQFNWVKHLSALVTTPSSAREVYDITLDSLGAVYATGYFSNSVVFEPGVVGQAVTAVSSFDAMVFKCDSAGAMQWHVVYGGNASDIGRSIVLDHFNNIYTTGTFSDSIDFDPGPGVAYLKSKNNPNSTYADIYYTKLTNSGDFIWAKSMGGKHVDQADGIVLDASHNLYTVGFFQSDTCDFDPDPIATHLVNLIPPPIPSFPSMPNNELFVHKMSCNDTTSTLLNIDACGQYVFNNETWTSSGTYVRVLRGQFGCDSTVTINLNIIADLGVNITINGFELGTTSTYVTYQWMKGAAIIPGATNPTYTVSENGDYRVIVSNENGCVDTSDVYTITNANSIGELNKIGAQVKIFPNPSDNIINITSPVIVNIQLTTVDGRTIMEQQKVNSLTIKSLANGVYFLKIMDKDNKLIKVEKIIKQ